MVTAERMASAIVQDGTRSRPGNATKNRRISTANPAAFDAVERKPAMGVGAPSYTSGAQKWNGTMDTLKPMPTKISANTANAVTNDNWPTLNISASWYRSAVPEKPKTR